jgi:hypothetical protein
MKRLPALALLCLASLAAVAGAATPATPTFFARHDYPDFGYRWVQVADTNGDGIPDIIEVLGNSATVLLGNGKGGFTQGPVTNIGPIGASDTFAAAALTGSGTIDLVFGCETEFGDAYGIGVSLGNGDGTFQDAIFYPAGTDTGTNYVALGDFNGDGITDVVTVGEQGIWLFTGTGSGTFNPAVLIPLIGAGPDNAGYVTAADLRNDGNWDLVVITPTGFAVLLGNGNGTFQPQQNYTNPIQQSGCGFVVGPIAEGGYPAIVANCGNLDYPLLYLGNGAGGFAPPTSVYLPGGVSAIADVNGNGFPDLLSSYVYIAYGNGTGKFGRPVSHPVQTSEGAPSNLVPANLRSPDLVDLVVQGTGAVSVLLNTKNKGFEDGIWTALSSGADCGAAGDFDGDGTSDLAVNTADGISILLGTGKAGAPFAVGSSITLADASCLITADLNGDGIPDLLVPSYTDPEFSTAGLMNAYLGNGDGTFTLASATPLSTVGFVAAADFNQNGIIDFATSSNLLALGSGDGTFQTPVKLVSDPPETLFNNIVAGDVNGDGWPDLVLTSGGADFATIWILLNNQHGGFTVTTLSPCPPTGSEATCFPSEVLLADLNGDGNLDLIVGEATLGGVVVYLGNGQGGFTQQQVLTDALEAPGPIMVADVNGDGIPDIALSEGGTIAIFLGRGNGDFYAPFYIGAGPEPGDILPMNLHGQSPTAGVPDLVAPDETGGVMTLINTTKTTTTTTPNK